MQTGGQVWYNISMKTHKLPKIGSLVVLRPYTVMMDFVKVESIENQEVRDFPPGTVAMVIEHALHPDDNSREVPILLVDGFAGWVFDDEWKYLGRQRRVSLKIDG